jgi:sulfite exporter TauE/SafE
MGVVFGLLGGRVIMAGLQQALSIVLGIAIITYVLLPQDYKSKLLGFLPIPKFTSPLKLSIQKLFGKGTNPSLFLIGILNGFLPCGFVYLGLAGAAATGEAISGGMFMMLFGFGTIPVMFVASYFGKIINLNIRKKLLRAVPVLAVLLAFIFILRGMNLGIPFISPKLNSVVTAVPGEHCN